MWMKIKCPACQTESSSWLLESSYKGQHRCWKCKALYRVEVDNGDLLSCQPMTEDELETLKAKQEAKKRGLEFAEEPAPPPVAKAVAQSPFEYAKVPDEPLATGGKGGDFAALARSSNRGLEFTRAEPVAEVATPPVQTSIVWPKAPDEPEGMPAVISSPSDDRCAGVVSAAPVSPAAAIDPKATEAPVMEGTPAKIDSFNFGFIVVNGKQYNYDVDILPDGKVLEREPGKGRIGSHAITRTQLEPIVKTKPQVILIGAGVDSMAKLSGDVQAWQQRGTDARILVMSSREAVEEFNKQTAAGKRAAALIHITC